MLMPSAESVQLHEYDFARCTSVAVIARLSPPFQLCGIKFNSSPFHILSSFGPVATTCRGKVAIAFVVACFGRVTLAKAAVYE